jgi:hypothetical protein
VEVARVPEAVVVRDSKDVAGPVLCFADAGWTTFLEGVRTGEFDRPGG